VAHSVLVQQFVQSTAKYAESTKLVWLSEQFTVLTKQPVGSIRLFLQQSKQRNARVNIESSECARRSTR